MKSSKILIGYFSFFFLLYVLMLLFLLSSCSVFEKAKQNHQEKVANRFFDEHPDKDAERCLEHFPLQPLKDSAHVDSVKNADNVDYTTDIEELFSMVDSLQADSINRYWIMVLDSSTTEMGNAFRKVLLKQQQDNAVLKETIANLRNAYKPCKPDTVFITTDHYMVDGAAAAAYEAQKKINAELQKKLDAASSIKKIRLWMLIAAGAIILLLIILLYNTIRFKKKLTIPPL